MDGGEALAGDLEVRQERGRAGHVDDHDRGAGLLELGGDDVAGLAGDDGEGDERGRDVEVLEGARHAVLAADGGRTELELRFERAEERHERLAPAGGILAELFEIFLERQARAGRIAAGGGQAGERFHHRADRAVARGPLGDDGIEAVGHDRADVRLAAEDRELGGHRFLWGRLRRATERMQHRVGADRGIEALDQAALGGVRESGDGLQEIVGRRRGAGLEGVLRSVGREHLRGRGLRHAVGVEEVAGDVDDALAAPFHDQATGVGDVGDLHRFEVLAAGGGEEGGDVLGLEDDGHAFLRFGQRDLGTIEAVILERHAVEVDVERRGELADGDGDAAGAEVIATLDQAADGRIAEETLQLALGRGVALLDLGGILESGLGVFLRGTRRATHAVAARAATDEHDDVARSRHLAAHAITGTRGDDRADLHALSHVARVVVFGDQAGRETDLVAVRGVAGGRAGGDLALRELARERLLVRRERIAGARHAHRLIHVGAAGKRVADRAAETGGRAAEGLDLRRVVMRLVLEHHQPLLDAAVDLDRDDDRSGVHLFGVFHVIELARALQFAAGDGCDVHQADRLALAVEAEAHRLVAFPRGFEGRQQRRIRELDRLQFGEEGRVAAVVGPIRVEQLDLRDRRLAAGLVAEVRLAELQVGVGHREAELLAEGGEGGDVLGQEARERSDRGRRGRGATERGGLGEVGFAGVDRIDQVGLDALQVFGRGAAYHEGAGRGDDRAFAAGDDLEALRGRIGALVELAGQELDREGRLMGGEREAFFRHVVDGRLGEDRRDRLADGGLRGALDVVTLEDAEAFQAREAERVPQVMQEMVGFGPEIGFLLDEKALHEVSPTLLRVGAGGQGETIHG